MVPNAPPNTLLDVKKSSYKKLSKFLEEKEKNGVIHIKELQKGVESIVGVEYEHEFIVKHRVVRYHKGEQNKEFEFYVCTSVGGGAGTGGAEIVLWSWSRY